MKKIIWLHGLGANKYDLQPIAEQLNLENVEHSFLQAPNKKISAFGGAIIPAWYDITGLGYERGIEDESGILSSYELIKHTLDNDIDSKKYSDVILAGFSQGGAMALYTGLKSEKVSGIVALSCYLPLHKSFGNIKNTNIRIFKAAGINDPTVKFELSAASEKVLSARGYVVDWKIYQMEHQICNQEITDIKKWFNIKFKSHL